MDGVVGAAISALFGGTFLMFLVVLVLGLCVYFLPTLIARGKPNFASVLVLNLFLGWTLVGWAVSLALAVASPARPYVVVAQPTAAPLPGWYPDPYPESGFVQRYWDGATWTGHVYGPTGPPPPDLSSGERHELPPGRPEP